MLKYSRMKLRNHTKLIRTLSTVLLMSLFFGALLSSNIGRTFADSPEIDGTIYFTGDAEPGSFTMVRVTDVEDGELSGIQI